MIYDALIIGKGPAGITASIYLKRYGYNVIVVGKNGGALENVSKIENYYGIKSISGTELVNAGIEQAKALNIEVITEEVLEINKENNFTVKTDKQTIESKTVILACGTSRNRYPKADKFEGVSYCATCDGFFYRKKKIGLIGNGNYMAHELSVLENIVKDITVFTDGKKLEASINPNILVVNDKITDIKGDEHISSIVCGTKAYDIDGLFIAIGNASGFTLAKHLGIELSGNSIKVNENYMTNIDGLFSCGDAVGGLLQVGKAVGEASICATSVSNYLKMNK